MTKHVIAEYGSSAVFEVVEENDFFAPAYYVREQSTGRIVSKTFSTKRRAVAVAEEKATRVEESPAGSRRRSS